MVQLYSGKGQMLSSLRSITVHAFLLLRKHGLRKILIPIWKLMALGNPISDRDSAVTRKSLGGGLCLYVNKNWCNTVVVRETLCTPDIELLSVSL